MQPAFSARSMMYDVGIDAITATTRSDLEGAQSTANTWVNMVYDRSIEGYVENVWQPAALLGYHGYKSGSVFVGYRHDGAMIRATGARSHRIWQDLGDGARPSRIDIALDVWYDRDVAAQMRGLAERIDASRREVGRGKPVGMRYVDGMGDGDSIYIGSRSSWRYVRIYDKMRESKNEDYKNVIRFEVEYKDDMARAVHDELRGSGDVRAKALSLVQSELARYGVLIQTGELITEMERVTIKREPTDIDRTIQWLQDQVAPTVLRLTRLGLTRDQLESILFASADLWNEGG